MSKLKTKTKEEYMNQLSQIALSKNNYRQLKSYSRLTKFTEVKNYLEKVYKLINIKCRLWIFYEGHLINVCDLDKCFLDENIIEYCIIILETMNNNKWPSVQLDNEKINDVSIKTSTRAFVGIINIGNSIILH